MTFARVLHVVEILARCFAIVLILYCLYFSGFDSPNNMTTSTFSGKGVFLAILAGGSTLIATKRKTALWRIITCLFNGLIIAGIIAGAVELLFVTEGRPVNLALAGFLVLAGFPFIASGLAIVWVIFAMLAPDKPSDVVIRRPKAAS